MRRLTIALVVVCANAIPLVAQDEAVRFQQAFDRIDELARRVMKDSDTPGMALAITNRKALLRVANYGYANKDSRELVTSETLFGGGSIGKSMTSVVILGLRDAGKLD